MDWGIIYLKNWKPAFDFGQTVCHNVQTVWHGVFINFPTSTAVYPTRLWDGDIPKISHGMYYLALPCSKIVFEGRVPSHDGWAVPTKLLYAWCSKPFKNSNIDNEKTITRWRSALSGTKSIMNSTMFARYSVNMIDYSLRGSCVYWRTDKVYSHLLHNWYVTMWVIFTCECSKDFEYIILIGC